MTNTLGEIGGFELIEELGRGGMGVVYRARDHALKRDLAVKLQSGEWTNDLLMLQRFLREAQILASINHPHVISIYAVGEHLGSPYFAMELLEHSVSDAYKLKTPTLPQLKRWMLEAARGLAALHERGVIHRDIKPGNLLLSKANSLEPERVKVADLGIASSGNLFGPRLTQMGAILGTTGYLAPEAMQPDLTLDTRADQYSLGVVFFELLARRAPFTDLERATAVRSGIAAPLYAPDIRQARPDVDPATAQLITRMLEFDRNARFPDTQSLIAELIKLQEPTVGTPSGGPPSVGTLASPANSAVPPPRPINTQARAVAPNRSKLTLLALPLIGAFVIAAFMWFNAAPVRSVAKPIAARPQIDTSSDEGIPLLGAAKSRGGSRAPQTGLVPDTEHTTSVSEPEQWANALLARYLLSSSGTGRTDWAFVLIDQQAGVIDAQLSGPESESQQFSGSVRSHRVEMFDEVAWDIYELSFKNDSGQGIEMRIECTDSLVSGGGVYIDGEDRRSFEIESSE